MFTAPTPPTDNLYKFLFVASLVTIIFLLYIRSTDQKETAADVYQRDSVHIVSGYNTKHLEKTMSTNEYKIVSSKKAIIALQSQIQSSQAKDRLSSSRVNKLVYMLALREKDYAHHQYVKDSLFRTKEKDSLFTTLALSRIKARESVRQRYYNLLFVGLIAAFIVFIFGIYMWYSKIQVPEEQAAKIKLETAELELSKLKETYAIRIVEPDSDDHTSA
jgi:hypothetical protein